MSLATIRAELRSNSDPKRAAFSQGYLKTGPGEYGEGDKCLGIPVPVLRRMARAHRDQRMTDVRTLLRSKWHEERALALLILVERYRRALPEQRQEIHDLYLANTAYINNWDLVDCSAEFVVGGHLDDSGVRLLVRLARSSSLWERRIAIISTRRWIKEGRFEPTLRIARMLLEDPHDLIHKATGWMLREVADRDRAVAEAFLREHLAKLPRTMLRYAIEKFPERLRKQYLAGTFA
jgi:3-methyladenine DNA glycosylase AlkD